MHDPEADAQLRRVTPARYALAMTGQTGNADRKIVCPRCKERRLHLYLTPARGWHCYGKCQKGGDIFSFAGHVYKISTRGYAFVRLKGKISIALLKLAEREGKERAVAGEHEIPVSELERVAPQSRKLGGPSVRELTRKVPCPECGAAAGERCRALDGTERKRHHKARVQTRPHS